MESARQAEAQSARHGVSGSEFSRQQGAIRLVAITALGAGLRILTLNSRSFWLDEATSVRQASWSIPMIVDRMSGNVHPPLFHILLHYWIRYFGRNELSVRSFPLLFGLIAIPLAYWVGATIYNRRIGVFSAAIIALSPYFIWYAQEARMYTLLLMFALLSTGSLYQGIQTRSLRWWAVYALSTAAGMFTHFFFAFLLITQALYVLAFFVIKRERDLRTIALRQGSWSSPLGIFSDFPEATGWLASMIVVLLPQAWWIPKVLSHRQFANGVFKSLNYGNPVTTSWHFNEIILAGSQALFGMHSDLATRDLSAIWPIAITVAFLLAGQVRRPSTKTWLLVITGVLATSILGALGQWLPTYEVRYFTAVAAPLAILMARYLAGLRSPALQILCGGLIVVSLVSYVDQSYNPDSIIKWDNRQAAQTVSQGFIPGDVIVLVPYYASSVLEYYLPPDEYFTVRPVPAMGTSGEPRNSVAQIDHDLTLEIGPTKRVWLVSCFLETPRIADDNANVIAFLKGRGYAATKYVKLHHIAVSLYEGSPSTQFFVNQGGGQ